MSPAAIPVAIAEVFFLALLALILLHRYAGIPGPLSRSPLCLRAGTKTALTEPLIRPNAPWRPSVLVLSVVWLGWFLCLAAVALVGLDIADAAGRACAERCVVALKSSGVETVGDSGFGSRVGSGVGEASSACLDSCARNRIIDVAPETLRMLWLLVYWITYAFCWTVYPLLQSYSTAGEFHFLERVRTSLKENLIFYGVCGVVMGILIIYIAAKDKLNTAGLVAVAMAASNSWGMFLLFCTLGYGLVEVPKRLWRSANREVMQRYNFFQAAVFADEFSKAHTEFREALQTVKMYDMSVRRDDIFRDYVETIVASCPTDAYRQIRPAKGNPDMSYKALVTLNRRVATAEHDMLRTKLEYEFALQEAFALEDIIRASRRPTSSCSSALMCGGEQEIPWSFPEQRKTGVFLKTVCGADGNDSSRVVRVLRWWQWLWGVHLRASVLRATAALLFAASLLVLWSEQIFGYVPKLSIFFQLLQGWQRASDLGLQLLVLIPVSYIAYCSFGSLFRLRLFSYYRLLPYHLSDANSLLFSAAYLCRLISPLAYNFLLMSGFGGCGTSAATSCDDSEIEFPAATFVEVMGQINLTPFLGQAFSSLFPIFLVIFAAATFFNLYTRFTRVCCTSRLRKFSFDIEFDDAHTKRGRDLVAAEREKRLRQLQQGSGEHTDLLSGAVMDTSSDSRDEVEQPFPSVLQRIAGSLADTFSPSNARDRDPEAARRTVLPSDLETNARRGIVSSTTSDFVTLDDAIEDASPVSQYPQSSRRGIVSGRH